MAKGWEDLKIEAKSQSSLVIAGCSIKEFKFNFRCTQIIFQNLFFPLKKINGGTAPLSRNTARTERDLPYSNLSRLQSSHHIKRVTASDQNNPNSPNYLLIYFELFYINIEIPMLKLVIRNINFSLHPLKSE